jgi:hypothetical protein
MEHIGHGLEVPEKAMAVNEGAHLSNQALTAVNKAKGQDDVTADANAKESTQGTIIPLAVGVGAIAIDKMIGQILPEAPIKSGGYMRDTSNNRVIKDAKGNLHVESKSEVTKGEDGKFADKNGNAVFQHEDGKFYQSESMDTGKLKTARMGPGERVVRSAWNGMGERMDKAGGLFRSNTATKSTDKPSDTTTDSGNPNSDKGPLGPDKQQTNHDKSFGNSPTGSSPSNTHNDTTNTKIKQEAASRKALADDIIKSTSGLPRGNGFWDMIDKIESGERVSSGEIYAQTRGAYSNKMIESHFQLEGFKGLKKTPNHGQYNVDFEKPNPNKVSIQPETPIDSVINSKGIDIDGGIENKTSMDTFQEEFGKQKGGIGKNIGVR